MALSLTVATGQATNGPVVTSLIPDTTEWGLKSENAGTTVYNCSSCPTNAPASLTYGANTISDLFKNRSDAVPITGQEVRGRSLLLKLQEVWQVSDGTNIVARFPAQAHMVVSFGLHDTITSTILGAFYQRLVGVPFRAVGDTPATAFQKLMTGITRYDIL